MAELLRQVAELPVAAPRGAQPDRTGQTIAHFVILEPLGQGGMGLVYAAKDQLLDRTVALKVMPESVARDERRRQRFLLEARSAAAVVHPNVASVFEAGEDDGTIFIAMERIAGTSVRALLDAHDGKLDLREALRIAHGAACALSGVHAAGIIHRDVKPANLMLASDGSVKLVDFGLAKLLEPRPTTIAEQRSSRDSELSMVDAVLGTPGYMSPEQANGLPLDDRSDVFALGVVLYEMITGVQPFRRATPLATLIAIHRDRPPPLGRLAPGTPAAVGRLVERCLRKSPKRRIAAECLASALAELLAELPASPCRPTRSPPADARKPTGTSP